MPPRLAPVARPTASSPTAPWAPVAMNCKNKSHLIFLRGLKPVSQARKILLLESNFLEFFSPKRKNQTQRVGNEPKLKHLPGQGSLLQKSICVSLPSHLRPPNCGAGSEQWRVLCLLPPPQDMLQALQLLHGDHFPSTGERAQQLQPLTAGVAQHSSAASGKTERGCH